MIGAMSISHWLIVIMVVVLLFGGKNKISALMQDFGKGIKEFKNGVKEIDNG
jgi:sec-independent protein translocase protein TatA